MDYYVSPVDPLFSDRFDVFIRFFGPWHSERKIEKYTELSANLKSASNNKLVYYLNSDFLAFTAWTDIMRSNLMLSHTISMSDKEGNSHDLIEVKCTVVKELCISELDYNANNVATLTVELAPGPYYEINYKEITL